MKPAIDYVAAATAVAEAAPVPEVSAETAAPAEAVAESAAAEPGETAEVAAPAAETKVAPVADKVTKTLADVAAAKADLRREREALDAESGPIKAVIQALKTRDAMALLAAANIPWSEAARQVLEGTGAKPPKAAAKDDDEPTGLKAEVAELRNRLAARDAAEGRAKVSAKIGTLVKDNPKFRHVDKMEATDQVLAFIEHYHKETGELPGATPEESFEIAAEAVEQHLAKEAKRWAKVLPGSSGDATKPISKSEVPAAEATSQQAKTLSNTTGSGPKTAPVASKKTVKTPEQYQQEVLNALAAQ